MGKRAFGYDGSVKNNVALCCELLSKICMFLAEEGQEKPVPPFGKKRKENGL